MKVLHVISSGGMYGAEAVILTLARQSAASDAGSVGIGVFHNAHNPNTELQRHAVRQGVPVYPIASRGPVDLKPVSLMRALVRDIRPDVVHAHGYKADVYAFAALRKTGTPLVSTCHTWYDNDLATRLYGAIDRRALRGFNAVVAVSTDVEARLLEAGLHPARIRIIMNGVDTGPFDEIADRRCYSGSSGPRLRIGLIGRLAPEKGVDIFLSAAAKVLEHADVDFVIAGDGPERTSLQAHINSLHLGQRVRLLGQVQAMPAFLGGLDILASASRQEGLPMALLEGMASGLPIAATAVGTVPGVVLQQQTGLLVPPENADALAEALLALVQSAKMREDLGRNARSLMLRDFSAERMTDDYLSMYREAIRG